MLSASVCQHADSKIVFWNQKIDLGFLLCYQDWKFNTLFEVYFSYASVTKIGCKHSLASHAYSQPMTKQQIMCEIQANKLFHKYVRCMVSDL